ncbi:hypothetical protein VTN31DRAFT_4454 [Thermomyces dupontii]|uniref:uncharacterized protein n=1 Tax=Talaromyces thermophilus TaxID=28565 RepID=UPI003742BC4E
MSYSKLYRLIIAQHHYDNKDEYRRLRRERVHHLLRSGAGPEDIFRLLRVRIRARGGGGGGGGGGGADTTQERPQAEEEHGGNSQPENNVDDPEQQEGNQDNGGVEEDEGDGGVPPSSEPQEQETRNEDDRRVSQLRKQIVLQIATERLEAGEYPFISLDEYRQLCTPEASKKMAEMERVRLRAQIAALRRQTRRELRKRAREE